MKKNLVKLPEFQTKGEAYSYLRQNAMKIIAQKRSLPTTTDDLDFGYCIKEDSKLFATKNKQDTAMVDGEIPVEVIANMAGWCDSQLDVMIKDNWNRSISDLGASGQRLFYHLKDHGEMYCYTLDCIIGRNPELFTKMIDLSMFNFKSDVKKSQALMMSSVVMETYDKKAYQLYKDHQIKQHSIGLQYVKIYLCMDSTEEQDTMYKENWDKYYPQVINKEKVDNYGFFWAVTESRINEVSAVLYGSNELTPVTSTTGKTNEPELDSSTGHKEGGAQELEVIETVFDVRDAIKKTKFFN
jgi:hypothetical protein